MAPICGLAVAIGLGAARPAAASPPSSWRVPAACGGGERVVERIAAQVGRPLTDDEPVAIDVAITEVDGGFAAAVELVSVRGAARRELRGPDCGAVVDAVALVVAVAIEDVSPPTVEDEASASVAAPPTPVRFVVGVEGGVDGGALPAVEPGAALKLVLARGPWRVELGGEIYRAGFAAVPGDDRAGVEVGLLGARLRGCRGLAWLRGCAGLALGRLEGRPVGLNQPATTSRRWSAAMVGIGATSRLGGLLGRRFAVTVDVDGLLALDRPEFVLADDTRLHQPAGTGWRLAVGFDVEIR